MAAPVHRRARSITSILKIPGQDDLNCGPTVLNVLVSAWQVRWGSVEERLATHPQEAKILDSGGCSVLYLALSRRQDDYPPIRIAKKILEAYPNAAWERHNGMTILELSCRNRASLEILEVLTQARPSIPEDATALPALWKAYCEFYVNEESFIQFLESQSADALLVGCKFQLLLRYITSEKMLPLTVGSALCSSHCSLELFKLICSTLGKVPHHHQVLMRKIEGSSVVSLAAAFDEAATFDRSLLSAKLNYLVSSDYVESMSFDIVGAGGLSMLHVALEHSLLVTNDELMRILTDDFDDKLLTTRHPKAGFFPVQMASLSSCDASLSTIYTMLRSAPQVLGDVRQSTSPRREFRNVTPIDVAEDATSEPVWISPASEQLLKELDNRMHSEATAMLSCRSVDPAWNHLIGAARAFKCPPKLMELLLTLHPEMIHQSDSNGWLPLHHAVVFQRGDDTQILSMILDAYPAACYHRDRNGCLPFHLACCNGKSLWVLEKLFHYNPQALEQVDGIWRLPPAFLAAQSGRARLSSIFYLLTRKPEVVQRVMTTEKAKQSLGWKRREMQNDKMDWLED
jgi:hypothetical protein